MDQETQTRINDQIAGLIGRQQIELIAAQVQARTMQAEIERMRQGAENRDTSK
jgi:hypothetical protein